MLRTMGFTAGLWVLLVFCGSALAGGFAVVPLRADLGKNKSSSLTVTNTEDAKTFEVRAVSWKQQNRADTYAPTDDLLLAPATFRLEKGASQVVRIQLNKPLDADERVYRVFIDEVPVSKEIRPNTLKTVVSMAIPVFVAPASGPIAKGEATLKASLTKDVLNIELANTGKANLKLREWVLTSGKAGELLKVPSAAYVLTGNTLTGDYPLRIQADGPLQLRAVTDRGSFSANVTR
jgi:fimbrial chaperone protein